MLVTSEHQSDSNSTMSTGHRLYRDPRSSSAEEEPEHQEDRKIREVRFYAVRVNHPLAPNWHPRCKHFAVRVQNMVYELTENGDGKKISDVFCRPYGEWKASRRRPFGSATDRMISVGKTDWSHREMQQLSYLMWIYALGGNYLLPNRTCQTFALLFARIITDPNDEHPNSHTFSESSLWKILPQPLSATHFKETRAQLWERTLLAWEARSSLLKNWEAPILELHESWNNRPKLLGRNRKLADYGTEMKDGNSDDVHNEGRDEGGNNEDAKDYNHIDCPIFNFENSQQMPLLILPEPKTPSGLPLDQSVFSHVLPPGQLMRHSGSLRASFKQTMPYSAPVTPFQHKLQSLQFPPPPPPPPPRPQPSTDTTQQPRLLRPPLTRQPRSLPISCTIAHSEAAARYTPHGADTPPNYPFHPHLCVLEECVHASPGHLLLPRILYRRTPGL